MDGAVSRLLTTMNPDCPQTLKAQGRSSHLDQRGQLHGEGCLIGAVATGMQPVQGVLAGRKLKKSYPFLALLLLISCGYFPVA